MRILRFPLVNEIVFLSILAVAAAMSVNYLRPNGLCLVKSWDQEKMEAAMNNGLETITPVDAMAKLAQNEAVFIDAREPEIFDEGHVPGSVNILPSIASLDLVSRLRELPKCEVIVIYCDSLTCDKSEILAERLKKIGVLNVAVMPEGLDGWLSSNGPLEATP